ncbi:MAG: Gx transporter family protein [Treponema sp.]|nr:Gx transporter family protein [Treponema sp.]
MEKIGWRTIAFYSSLCFFLSAAEYAVPKPVPFFRIGFANLPVMLSLSRMKKKETLILILMKIFFQAVVTGTLFSHVLVFSFAGSAASGLCMMASYFLLKGRISWIGVSMCGGLANNAAQLFCARLILFGEHTRLVAPALLCISFCSSLALGLFAQLFCSRSEWYRSLSLNTCPALPACKPERKKKSRMCKTGLAALSVLFLLLLLSHKPALIYAILLVLAAFVFKERGKLHPVPLLFLTAFVTFFSLLSPYGRILFSLGKFHVTLGALEAGLVKSGKLCAFVLFSRLLVSADMQLPGKAGAFFSLVTGYFSCLTQQRISMRCGMIVSSIDRCLCAVWQGCSVADSSQSENP